MLVAGPLASRDGAALKVMIFTRISTNKQDERSLDDQAEFCRRYIQEHYSGQVIFRTLAGTGSGEWLDREEYQELSREIDTQSMDVVICDDLSRICRRYHILAIGEQCEDASVRMIAVHDRIDTLDHGWRDSATLASWHHERSNRDSSHRVKRTLNNRFDNGGCVQTVPFGYIKPQGSSQDSDLRKDPAAENFVLEMFRRLEDGANFAEVADWFNSESVPIGPYCRGTRWVASMIARLVRNPILKGWRLRNRHMSKRVNKTGRHRTVKAPPDMLRVRKCPHLAYIEPARYDALIHTLQVRNAWCRRARADRPDSLRGVPKKSTLFPGQHLRCGICGRYLYWHGKNTRRVMVCSGATSYECWNSLYVDGAACAEAVLGKAAEVVAEMPGFDELFGSLVREQAAQLDGGRVAEREKIEKEVRQLERQQANCLEAVKNGVTNSALFAELNSIEVSLNQANIRLRAVDSRPQVALAMPRAEELRLRLGEVLNSAPVDDQEVRRQLAIVIPDMFVVPYRTVDGGDIVPRVEFRVALTSLLPEELRDQEAAAVLQRDCVVTVGPVSQRVAHRQQAAELRSEGLTIRQVSKRLSIAYSAAERALRVHRLMKERGLDEPYLRITEIEDDMNRLRRHRSPRFRFNPLDGFPRNA
jgi:hypothetical protein